MRTIEAIVGRERFDAWLRGWFDRHQFQPVTSAIFLADIRANLVEGDKALEDRLMLDKWVYDTGLPSNMVKPTGQEFAAVDSAVRSFTAGNPPASAAWAEWNTDERLRFLNKLPRKLSKARLDELDMALKLDDSRNNEVLYAWLDLAVRNRYDPAVPALERFLTVQGRRKFVKPLIEALAEDETWGRPIAARVYARARSSYHPITTRDLDKLNLLNGAS
jgi:aminopeptidase N